LATLEEEAHALRVRTGTAAVSSWLLTLHREFQNKSTFKGGKSVLGWLQGWQRPSVSSQSVLQDLQRVASHRFEAQMGFSRSGDNSKCSIIQERLFYFSRLKMDRDPSEIEREMRRFKLEALEKGELTDFSFLVGADAESAEVRPDLILIFVNFIEWLFSS